MASFVLAQTTFLHTTNKTSDPYSMEEFSRLTRLPAYVFNITGELKAAARQRGEDIIDFGMGNPDGATPKHIVDKMIEAAQKTATHRYSLFKGHSAGCAKRSATGISGATMWTLTR